MANDDTRPMNDADIGGEIAGGDQPTGGAPLKVQGDDLSPTTDFGAGDTAPGDTATGGDQAPASKVEQVKQALGCLSEQTRTCAPCTPDGSLIQSPLRREH